MRRNSTIAGIVDYAGRLDGVDADALRDGLEIAGLHHQVEQVVESHLAAWGLTARQVEIMELLYHNAEGVLTPADLSEDVGLTRSAMTSALDSLEKLGHTVRGPHPTDRRMVTISLTPAGRKLMAQRLPERYRDLSQVMSALSKRERALLIKAYRKVLDVLVQDVAKAAGEGQAG